MASSPTVCTCTALHLDLPQELQESTMAPQAYGKLGALPQQVPRAGL